MFKISKIGVLVYIYLCLNALSCGDISIGVNSFLANELIVGNTFSLPLNPGREDIKAFVYVFFGVLKIS